MTRKPRSRKNIEKKIVELYVRLHKRQTTKPFRLQNIRKKLFFFKQLLEDMDAQASTSSNSDLVQASGETLQTESSSTNE